LQFIDVRFQVSSEVVGDLQSFYADRLGFESLEIGGGDVLALAVGSATARFSEAAASRSPFYHFALLVPGNRFDAAYEWLGARTQLLPDPDTGDRIFEFDNWSALACYCLDPAGNIVELIAHRGISESPIEGAFSAGEVVDFSEVGLVVPDKKRSVALLEQQMDLGVWDGEVADPHRLVFVGERARTLILCHPGRGWLPTGRPAEPHPLELTLKGAGRGEARIPGTRHRVTSV
jgi:hypothetical protein